MKPRFDPEPTELSAARARRASSHVGYVVVVGLALAAIAVGAIYGFYS